MTRQRDDTTPQAQALRAAGYVRVPGGLWLLPEERDLVLFMAEKHLPTIKKIKEQTQCHLNDRQ
jgi:hypothetical protein